MGNEDKSSLISTYLALGAGMAIFGSATPLSKIVGETFPAMLASTLRMATAIAILLPVFLFRQIHGREELSLKRHLAGLDRCDWLLLLGIGAVGTFGFTLFLILGLRIAPGSVGAIVMGTTPAVTATGAMLFLKDRLNRWKVIAIGLAVMGVSTVNLGSMGGGGGDVWLGSSLVFGAVSCEAAFTLFGKRLSVDMTPLLMTLLAALIAGILFVPLALFQISMVEWSEITPGDWAALIWWGAGTMGLGSIIWFHGVMRVSGTTASAFMGVMPVSALLLSYVLLNEAFQAMHLVGIAAVLSALAAVIYSDIQAGAG